MKLKTLLFVCIFMLALTLPSESYFALKAPEGHVWSSNSGATFEKGFANSIEITWVNPYLGIASAATIGCSADPVICWEIVNGGTELWINGPCGIVVNETHDLSTSPR